MRTEFIETLSLQDLVKLGYKEKDHEWYLGNVKYPTHRISKNLEPVLGRKFKILNAYDGKIEVEDMGETYLLKPHVIKTKIKPQKIERTICKDEVCKFNGYSFDFPCSLRHLGRDEAVQLAKWVFKVTGGKP